jgi:hypothetical protein
MLARRGKEPHWAAFARALPRTTNEVLHTIACAAVDLNAIHCATGGTPFQRAVWAALRGTYGAAYRQSCGGARGCANPIALVVACHRVIGADGSFTCYGGGIDSSRPSAGSRNWKMAPCGRLGLARNCPPWASMIVLQIESPMPMPLDFVV